MDLQVDAVGNIERRQLLIEIATRNVVRLAAADTLGNAAAIMAARRISSIVVSDDGDHPAGIVTERNIVQAMQAGLPQHTPLQQVMSAPVISVPATITMLEAYQLCQRNCIRHLAIVDDQGVLVGVASETDFRLHLNLAALAGQRLVASAMNRAAPGMAPHASLQDALDLMRSHRDSCVVVVEDERPLGIVTERDIVRLYAQQDRTATRLRDIMTAPVLSVQIGNSINEAAKQMLAAKVRHLVVVDERGRLAGLIGEHDLTQAMALGALEDKLAADGGFLHTLLDTLPDLVWLKDSNGVYLACNSRLERFFGAAKDAIVGKTDYDFVGQEQADAFRAHDRLAMAADRPCINEEWLSFAADGYRGLFETIKTPMRDSHGKLLGVLGIARDITERVTAANALQELNAELSATLQAVPDLLFELDGNGRYLNIWAHDASLLAAQTEALLGHTVDEMLPPDAAATVLQSIRAAQDSGYANGQVIRLDLPQGESWFELSTAAKAGADAGEPRFIMLSRNITQRRQIENALREREEIFSAIVNQAADSIVLIDVETLKFVEFNQIAHESLGYTRNEFARLTVADVQAQLPEPRIRELMVQSIEHQGNLLFETLHHRKNGSIRETQISSRAVSIRGKTYLSAIWSDISERKAAERKIAAARQALDAERMRFQAILDNAPLGIWYLGNDDKLQFVNKTFCNAVGVPESKFLAAEHYVDVLPQEIAQNCLRSDRECLAGNTPHLSQEWIPFTDGRAHLLEIVKVKLADAKGNPTGLIGLATDITERKQAEENLRIIASVFDNSQDAIVITDADNKIIDVNPAFTRITGYARAEVLGRDPGLLASGRQDPAFYRAMWQALRDEGAWRGEIWNRRKNGELYAELLSIAVLHNEHNQPQLYVAVFSDISHIKAHEAELSRVAHYDTLTGIPNRVLLADRMKQAKAQTMRDHNLMAVCYLDLDGFKAVNDTLGHDTGDQVLVEVARRISGTIRGGDTVARLGGDEFVILLLGLERAEECTATLERLLHAIAQPYTIKEQSFTLGASIGVSIYPLDNEDADTLLRHADQAMYVAKQSGKHRYHIYDPALDQRARLHHEFVSNLRHALERGQFELYYQPKIDLRSGRLVGAEALIRWHHPERGLLPPAEFLDAVGNSELDLAIGAWVIDSALAQLEQWRRHGLDIEVSINISAHHLESPGFVDALRHKVAQYPDLPAGRLQIEVLETAALEDIGTVNQIIAACREFGVGFALDDFGTGYSSLTYLSRLPVDALKIDQSFVRDMLEDKGDLAIVQGIIALARAFERQTVAEGIETEQHYRTLLDMGCEIGQGYHIARPMPAAELVDWSATLELLPAYLD